MTQRYLQPSSGGLRMPTDPGKQNGVVINPPRYAELGGLDKPGRIMKASDAPSDIGNPFHISKPGGGR